MKDTKTCIICGEIKQNRYFVSHKNTFLDENYSFCKDCVNNITDFTSQESVMNVCQLLNVPYIKRLHASIIEKHEELTMTYYLKRLAPFKKYNVFADSDYADDDEDDVVVEFEVTPEMIQKWGTDYPPETYSYFENELRNLIAIRKPQSEFEMRRYIQNVKLSLVLNTALREGDAKTIPNLRKSYNDDLKDLGFDEVLNAKDDDGQTLGQRIQRFEKTKPIPDRDEFEDVSMIEKYFKKWFQIPIKRNLGLATEEEVQSLYEKD